MARYTEPKVKLMRRAGADLNLKTNSGKVARRLNIPPGQHGRKGTKKLSDYGIQLREKQKVKWLYGVLEKQFRQYFQIATKNPAATGSELLSLLERRLDNTLFRLGLAPTRAAARQMIAHGNVQVNDKKLTIPSYQVRTGDTIAITPKAAKIPAVAELLEDKGKNIPKWLERKATVGKVIAVPDREDVDADINENLIVEFYSR